MSTYAVLLAPEGPLWSLEEAPDPVSAVRQLHARAGLRKSTFTSVPAGAFVPVEDTYAVVWVPEGISLTDDEDRNLEIVRGYPTVDVVHAF